MTWVILSALVVGLGLGFAYGSSVATRRERAGRVDDIEAAWDRGLQAGADDLANAYLAAAARAPDPFEAWPALAPRERWPS